MGNFLASLRSSSLALDALQRSVVTSQNNVSNASTPGYVRQHLALHAAPFDPFGGLAGGVVAGAVVSTRDAFAEGNVRRTLSQLGASEQQAVQLAWTEAAVDVNNKAGVPATMDRLFRAFTSWSLAPGSMAEKENVYAAAADFAVSFNRTADSVARSAAEAKEQIQTTLGDIDAIVERIRLHNADRRQGSLADAGVDAMMHSDLERLAELVDIQAVWQDDGTVTVLAGNEAPLVVGDRAYRLTAEFAHGNPAPLYPDALPPVHIIDASGNDVTKHLKGGKLGALIDFRNNTVPHYLGGGTSVGELNRLATRVADRVNEILARGYPAPDLPVKLFEYDASAVAAAHSIRVNPAMTPSMLQATDFSVDPPVVNGNALALSELADPSDPADMLDGLSYIAAFGKISADAGRDLANAQIDAETSRLLAVQAQNLRDEISGISLDEEAVRLVEYQRAYQATARFVTVLDELTQMAVNLGRV